MMENNPIDNLDKDHLPMEILLAKIIEELRGEKRKAALKSGTLKHLTVIK